VLERLVHVGLASEVLNQLSTSRFEDVLLFVCQQPQTPELTLADLAADSSYQTVRAQALQRVTTAEASSEVLTHLSNSPHQDVALAVAGHAHTATDTLLQLARHHAAEPVRGAALAQITHRELDAAALSELANSVYCDVLELVARHPATPATCYEQLARNLGSSLSRDYVRTEYRTEQEWVDDTEYDGYGSSYSSSGHYEDRQVPVHTPDYERINQLLLTLPLELRRAVHAQPGNLQSDSSVNWAL
jgi:hypothetical protein